MRNRLLILAQVTVVAAAVVLAAARFLVLDAGSHSASDTLRPWLVEAALIALAAALAVATLRRLLAAGRRA